MNTSIALRNAAVAAMILLNVAPAVVRAEHGPAALTFDQARTVMTAALKHARAQHAPGAAIAIVDAGGHLMLLERLDGTFPAAADISAGKARTAALFQRATRDFEKIVNDGRTAMVGLSDLVGFTPLQGGIPLAIDGQVAGAVGVSGAASAEQDEEIAEAAADAFAAGLAFRGEVLHLDRKRVAGAFRQGAALHETADYKVHASRRDGPGEAEIHVHDTDVFYVLDGRATLVTGGTLRDGRETDPGEIRGKGIDAGSEQALAAGDVVVVPRGVPHWFKSVSSPFTYFVVKASG